MEQSALEILSLTQWVPSEYKERRNVRRKWNQHRNSGNQVFADWFVSTVLPIICWLAMFCFRNAGLSGKRTHVRSWPENVSYSTTHRSVDCSFITRTSRSSPCYRPVQPFMSLLILLSSAYNSLRRNDTRRMWNQDLGLRSLPSEYCRRLEYASSPLR